MNQTHPHSFGALLKRYRDAAGLTQEALAERAALSPRGLIYLERGVRRPYPDTVRRLAAALALSPRDRAAFEAAARHVGDQALGFPAPSSPHPAVVAPPLVGRARELALLARHLGGEGPPVLLLAGEPGIGKSRLLQEAAQHAVRQRWQVLEGGCQRRGGQEPYAPLLGALKRYIGGQTPVQVRADLQGCAWLVRLLPELADGPIEPLPTWTVSPEQERRLMFAAVARFLANVAGPAGTLLLLDDLQWAGPDALDLLATLVRSAAEVPLRVVGAYRDTEVGPQDPLSVLLADLAHAGLALHHTLAPLSAQEAGKLLDGLLLDVGEDRIALRARVLQRAGGVPFFLLSCVQGLRLDKGEGSAQDAVPWDVAQGIRQRVAALPETAQEVLGMAAVIGREVPRGLLVDAMAWPEEEVLGALTATRRAHVLEEAGEEGYYFTHDVIREVVEADLGAGQRAVLHRRVAEALERAPGAPPVEALAYHYARSGVQEKAVLYLEQAGDKALARAAYAAAEGYYQELVDRLERLGRAQDAARVREKLGVALRILVRYDAALAALEDAAKTYDATGDLESLARTLALIGRVHGERGTPEEGLARLQPLLAVLEPGGASRGLAMLYVWLAFLLAVSGRYSEYLSAAERATGLARALQDERILVEAENWRVNALLVLGRVEEACVVLEEAIPLAEAVGDLDSLGAVLNLAGLACSLRGEFATSWPYFERALEVATLWGDRTMIAANMVNSGLTAFWQGDWEQARGHAEQAAAMSRRIGVSWVSAYAVLPLGHLCLAKGVWEEAAQCMEEALTVAERRGDLDDLRWMGGLLAERDLLEGCADAARARLVPLLDRPGLEELYVTTEILPRLAWAHLELGEIRQAEEMVAQCITRARGENLRRTLADALRVQAMVLIRQERWEEAEAALAEGLALAQGMPYPYAEARLLHVYGQMQAQKGEPETARERLEAALAISRRLGARKDSERVEQDIAALFMPRL